MKIIILLFFIIVNQSVFTQGLTEEKINDFLINFNEQIDKQNFEALEECFSDSATITSDGINFTVEAFILFGKLSFIICDSTSSEILAQDLKIDNDQQTATVYKELKTILYLKEGPLVESVDKEIIFLIQMENEIKIKNITVFNIKQ